MALARVLPLRRNEATQFGACDNIPLVLVQRLELGDDVEMYLARRAKLRDRRPVHVEGGAAPMFVQQKSHELAKAGPLGLRPGGFLELDNGAFVNVTHLTPSPHHSLTHRLSILLDDLRAQLVVIRMRHRVHELVAIRAQQPLKRMAHNQERNRVVLGVPQLGERDPRILATRQAQRHDVRLLEERGRVAGQYVEVVHPRRRRRLEHIAPDQMMLATDEELPRVRPVQRVVSTPLQPELVALGAHVSQPLRHAPIDALHLGGGERRLVARPMPHQGGEVQGDLFGDRLRG